MNLLLISIYTNFNVLILCFRTLLCKKVHQIEEKKKNNTFSLQYIPILLSFNCAFLCLINAFLIKIVISKWTLNFRNHHNYNLKNWSHKIQMKVELIVNFMMFSNGNGQIFYNSNLSLKNCSFKNSFYGMHYYLKWAAINTEFYVRL